MAMMDLSSYLSGAFLSSFITLANVMAAIGGLLYVASISMTTVIPLRMAAIASAFFFLCYGIFARSFPSIFLYAMLLPLNLFRLYQMNSAHQEGACRRQQRSVDGLAGAVHD